jgi:phosphoglycerate-specific signal transduction histidine kinase
MTGENPALDAIDSVDAVALAEALRQPLTAASNYIGAVRIMLGSDGGAVQESAIEQLDRAELQILRAGDIVRRFQRRTLKQAPKD